MSSISNFFSVFTLSLEREASTTFPHEFFAILQRMQYFLYISLIVPDIRKAIQVSRLSIGTYLEILAV